MPDSSNPQEDLRREARQLTPALYGFARILRFRGVSEAGLQSLPPSELEVLRYVLDSPGVGVGTLARELGLQTSNVSTTVRSLVGRGLLQRESDPHDRRSVQLHATLSAHYGMARIEEAWTEIFAEALEELPEDQRAALSGAVPALRALRDSLKVRWMQQE